jgi:hypothetical protein
MPSRVTRCVVVEVPETSPGVPDLVTGPKDVLPWADPYIAALLTSRRLQAALDDSLCFIEREQDTDWTLSSDRWNLPVAGRDMPAERDMPAGGRSDD